MSPPSTPAAARAASAAACSRSVTKSLYFDTTTANRIPFADWLPSRVITFFHWRRGPTPAATYADASHLRSTTKLASYGGQAAHPLAPSAKRPPYLPCPTRPTCPSRPTCP